MSNTGKQSPLGVNVLGSVLNNQGLSINPITQEYIGNSKSNGQYIFGKLIQNTSLRLLTLAINDAYLRNLVSRTSTNDVYDKLISIGRLTIPGLGNSKPVSYDVEDPANIWTDTAVEYGKQKGIPDCLPGPANSGYALTDDKNHGQQATWLPYTGVNTENPNSSITQWGYVRLHALQAWNEFNWNGEQVDWSTPEYKEFLTSLLTAESFVKNSNQFILSSYNSKSFLNGTFSNMNDLISGDVTGVSLSTYNFGTDLVNLGNAIDLSTIDSFGLPSNIIRTLYNIGAAYNEVVLALLISDLTTDEVELISQTDQLLSNTVERKIYNSLLLIKDELLIEILALLNCKTRGIQTLADLLDIKKLFPSSYQTLTVPLYNIESGPTNSKTYYLIFQNESVNSQITSSTISEIIGTQIIPGIPPTVDETAEGTDYYTLPVGYGSYLYNIIPQDIAVAAGAFSYSMQQIRNIKYCDIKTFAQAVKSIETNVGLPLTNGTNIPTDITLANAALDKIALGSGPYGTYTMSDLFGSMSGLPYPWQKIYESITQLQTTKLANIYRENFLAVTWQGAQVTVQYSTSVVEDPPGVFTTYYTVTGVTLTNPGGGYGRGTAPAPIITISGGSGATAVCTIGTNDTTAGSNNTGTFGRVTSVTLTSPGIPSTTVPTISIQFPPTATLAVQSNGSIATGGTNTASGTTGWSSPMNSVVEAYINQANSEIASILSNNLQNSRILNAYWNILGSQLKREQRTRYTAISPVAIVPPDSNTTIRKDYFVNQYPNQLYSFIDAVPELAQDTKPHMIAQTLEAISDLCSPGGQSLVAFLRESRNKFRLLESGITLDNNILDTLTTQQEKELITNNTLDNSNPSWLLNVNCTTNEILYPVPYGTVTDGLFEQAAQLGFGNTNTIVPVLTEPEETIPPYIISIPPQVNPEIPENLDTTYTASTLLPSALTVQQAIDIVIECNCDCWID